MPTAGRRRGPLASARLGLAFVPMPEPVDLPQGKALPSTSRGKSLLGLQCQDSQGEHGNCCGNFHDVPVMGLCAAWVFKGRGAPALHGS